MIKKLLILPLLWGILGLGAFASADSNGFTCLWEECSPSSVNVYNVSCSYNEYEEGICSIPLSVSSVWSDSVDLYYSVYMDWEEIYSYSLTSVSPSSTDDLTIFISSDDMSETTYNKLNNKTYSSLTIWGISLDGSFSNSVNITSSAFSNSASSDSSNDNNISLWGLGSIPSSFTSGLTSLVNNFGSTLVNWIPTIILVALWIYGIFALFRVIRNYSRSAFRW